MGMMPIMVFIGIREKPGSEPGFLFIHFIFQFVEALMLLPEYPDQQNPADIGAGF